jgi:hypothetical protein
MLNYPTEWLAKAASLRRAGLSAESRALNAACGSGYNARRLSTGRHIRLKRTVRASAPTCNPAAVGVNSRGTFRGTRVTG